MVSQFKLQNGLPAVLYSTLEELPKLYRLCANAQLSVTHYGSGRHCVVKIKLNKESIWLIFYQDISEKYAKSQLQTSLTDILDCNVYLAIYCNRIYKADVDLILESVKNKTPPAISAVLMPL